MSIQNNYNTLQGVSFVSIDSSCAFSAVSGTRFTETGAEGGGLITPIIDYETNKAARNDKMSYFVTMLIFNIQEGVKSC